MSRAVVLVWVDVAVGGEDFEWFADGDCRKMGDVVVGGALVVVVEEEEEHADSEGADADVEVAGIAEKGIAALELVVAA
jgi:hypothetical protein